MIEISGLPVGEIWRHVFEGRVQEIVEATRSHRAKRNPGDQAEGNARALSAVFAEPSLSSRIGHHYHLAKQYGEVLKKMGYKLDVLHAFKHRLDTHVNWHPWFYTPHHTLAYKAIECIDDLGRVEEYFAAEFESALAQYKPNIWLLGTVRFTNVFALVKSIIQSGHIPDRTIFGVLEVDEVPDCVDKSIAREAFSRAASAFNETQIPHRLVVETDHARHMLITCGFRRENVKCYQYVAAKRVVNAAVRPPRSGRRARIGYVGGTRPVRNPEVIAKLLCETNIHSLAEWNVQMDLPYIKKHCGNSTFHQLKQLDAAGAIRLYSTALEEKEYYALLSSLDFVVMPYSDRYVSIGSGVLIEAIYSEVIPVLPRKSSMYELYISLGGQPPSFDDVSVSSVAQAVRDALEDWEVLSQTAAEVNQHWCEHPESAERWESDLKSWIEDKKSQ